MLCGMEKIVVVLNHPSNYSVLLCLSRSLLLFLLAIVKLGVKLAVFRSQFAGRRHLIVHDPELTTAVLALVLRAQFWRSLGGHGKTRGAQQTFRETRRHALLVHARDELIRGERIDDLHRIRLDLDGQRVDDPE